MVDQLRLPDASVEELADFSELYRRYVGFVWRCLQAHGVPTRLLDDATQEVFMAVHRALPSFRQESTPRTWLYGVVRNVAYKQRRTLARKGAEPLTEEPTSSEPTPQEQAENAQAAQFVRRFLGSLDHRKRDIFVLVLLEQVPVPEAATILKVPLNTAYTRLRAVRTEFREALEREGEQR